MLRGIAVLSVIALFASAAYAEPVKLRVGGVAPSADLVELMFAKQGVARGKAMVERPRRRLETRADRRNRDGRRPLSGGNGQGCGEKVRLPEFGMAHQCRIRVLDHVINNQLQCPGRSCVTASLRRTARARRNEGRQG